VLRELNPLELETQSNPDLRIPSYSLQKFPNGVDRIIEKRGISLVYEELCFIDLNRKLTQGFAIGPHLIDYIFTSKRSHLGGLVRPDAMLLKNEGGNVFIDRMYEFKMGDKDSYRRKIPGKIEGFSLLSEKLREYPDFLPNRLALTIGEDYYIPPEIEVPKNIPITFYFPDYRESTSPAIDFRMLPQPQFAAA